MKGLIFEGRQGSWFHAFAVSGDGWCERASCEGPFPSYHAAFLAVRSLGVPVSGSEVYPLPDGVESLDRLSRPDPLLLRLWRSAKAPLRRG